MNFDKIMTIPVFLVNGVYFPTQKLRFKISENSNRQLLEKEDYFGIVSKRLDGEDSKNDEKYPTHYSVGLLVKIIDQ